MNTGFLLIKKSVVSHISDNNSFMSVSSVSICIIEMVCAQSKAIILKIIYHWSYISIASFQVHSSTFEHSLLSFHSHCTFLLDILLYPLQSAFRSINYSLNGHHIWLHDHIHLLYSSRIDPYWMVCPFDSTDYLLL